MIDFEEFAKIARLNRECAISEKIDGTNAQVIIGDAGEVVAGSRTRIITPNEDNFGFALWTATHAEELRTLGPGRHYGEWWGSGIQRKYGLTGADKRFSLFNSERWGIDRPACCQVVPILYKGLFSTGAVEDCLARLRTEGSIAAPGFMKPEGVVIWHTAARINFKVTLERDSEPKNQVSGAQAPEKATAGA